MTGPVVEVFSGELAPEFERAMPTAAGSPSGKGVA